MNNIRPFNKGGIMVKYVGYTRVSTDKQGKQGYGASDQLQTINEFVKNDQLLQVFQEEESGSKNNRPQLTQALELCKKEKAILVEDCASACAVSHLYSGVALMGTSLPDSFIPVIRKKYKEVIVALDRDATTKAFDISNKLRYYIPTKVKMLQDDLKYFNEQEIEDILQNE